MIWICNCTLQHHIDSTHHSSADKTMSFNSHEINYSHKGSDWLVASMAFNTMHSTTSFSSVSNNIEVINNGNTSLTRFNTKCYRNQDVWLWWPTLSASSRLCWHHIFTVDMEEWNHQHISMKGCTTVQVLSMLYFAGTLPQMCKLYKHLTSHSVVKLQSILCLPPSNADHCITKGTCADLSTERFKRALKTFLFVWDRGATVTFLLKTRRI